jgi:hypothetical protein
VLLSGERLAARIRKHPASASAALANQGPLAPPSMTSAGTATADHRRGGALLSNRAMSSPSYGSVCATAASPAQLGS